MHLPDDEYKMLRPYHIASYRVKKSSKMDTSIQTIGFVLVLIIIVIIYSNLKTTRINLEGSVYNNTYLQFINDSLHESRRFRLEIFKNLSMSYNKQMMPSVILSLKQYAKGIVEAGYEVDELYQRIQYAPISNLKSVYNFSNEFYKVIGNQKFKVQPIKKYSNHSIKICEGRDWVDCNGFECKVIKEVLEKIKNKKSMISCYYSDIIHINDTYLIDTAYRLDGDTTYNFENSDHVKIFCVESEDNRMPFHKRNFWTGIKTGFRPIYIEIPETREQTPHVLILALDSTPRNIFTNYLPRVFTVLTEELKAVALQNFHINNSGMLSAFNIMLKKAGLKLTDEQKINRNIYLYPDNILIKRLHDDGYYTAYFTDFPMISSKNNKFLPDYNLTHFFEENEKILVRKNITFSDVNCVGELPKYVLLMNITRQYTQIPGKHFSYTLISNITDYPRWHVEENLIYFLRSLKNMLKHTLFILMTSQIRVSSAVKSTLKVEDHNQHVFIVLPYRLLEQRPDAGHTLWANKDMYTTPVDIDTTILDAVGLRRFSEDDNGSDSELPKGRSLLEIYHNVQQQYTLNPIPPTL